MKLLTPSEVAEMTQVQLRTVVRLSQYGVIPAVKIGGQWRYLSEQIEDWIRTSASNLSHRILAVDDDPKVLDFLDRVISKNTNHEVIRTTKGERAIDHLSEDKKISVVLLDLMMSPVSGVDVLKWMHENEIRPAVLVVTGFPEGDLMEQAAKYGFFGVLKKPVDGKELVRAVELLISGMQGKRKAA